MACADPGRGTSGPDDWGQRQGQCRRDQCRTFDFGAIGRSWREGVAVRVLALLLVLALGACGVDGPPHPKGQGVNVSGEARIGVVGRL